MSGHVVIPRPFKLRLEFDAASGKKHKTYLSPEHVGFISYGCLNMNAEQKDNPRFDCVGYWQGMIIGIQGQQCGEMMYNFVIRAPLDYPYAAPIIRFSTKVVLSCVDNKGYVHVDKIPNFKWEPTKNIADVLMAVRDAMKDRASIEASYRVRDQEFFEVFPDSEFEKNFS